MPHRPPDHPLPRSIVWRQSEIGRDGVGTPLAEWAYVSPNEPEGIGESSVPFLPEVEQAALARLWFLANYEALGDGPWGEFIPGGAAFGESPWGAPEPDSRWSGGVEPPPVRTSLDVLETEFEGLVPIAVLTEVALFLGSQGNWWKLRDDLPDYGTEALTAPVAAEQVQAALARVERALDKAAGKSAGIGHNHGPPLIDASTAVAIATVVAEGKEAASKGEDGKRKAPAIAERMWKLAIGLAVLISPVVVPFANKIAELAAEDVWHGQGKVMSLFHSLMEAASALAHWATSLPLF